MTPSIVTVQLPAERVHVDGVKDTDPVPDCDQVMVPVGAEPEPATIAVQAAVASTYREETLHDTVVEVVPGGGAVTATEVVPELASS